jgi:hypothetical protein
VSTLTHRGYPHVASDEGAVRLSELRGARLYSRH